MWAKDLFPWKLANPLTGSGTPMAMSKSRLLLILKYVPPSLE